MRLSGKTAGSYAESGRIFIVCPDCHVYGSVIFYNLVFQSGNLVLSGGNSSDLAALRSRQSKIKRGMQACISL